MAVVFKYVRRGLDFLKGEEALFGRIKWRCLLLYSAANDEDGRLQAVFFQNRISINIVVLIAVVERNYYGFGRQGRIAEHILLQLLHSSCVVPLLV
ncbi:hypothetical protein D3C77_416960 [compost metagenome]